MQDNASYNHSLNVGRILGVSDGTAGGYAGKLHHQGTSSPWGAGSGGSNVRLGPRQPSWPERVAARVPLVVHLVLGVMGALLGYSNPALIGLADRPGLAVGLGFFGGLFGIAIVAFALQLALVAGVLYVLYLALRAWTAG